MTRSAAYLLILVAACAVRPLCAQISPVPPEPDSAQINPGSEIDTSRAAQKEIPVERIVPWTFPRLPQHYPVSNDSLLRWQIWPNWGEYYAYREDVIAYRQGTTGRVDAFDISGFGPYEQSLTLDGIDMSNPVTGLINYNFVPHNKIREVEESYFGEYASLVRLKNYYILKPVSYLNYDETKENYRNLEFMVSQNFRERTNVEISFWDRRDGGNYPNNSVEGNQITGRVYHYLSNKVQLRAMILRNFFNRNEPFGYAVSNPLTFSFSEFGPVPNQSNALSETLRRDFIAGIYHRGDTTRPEQAGLEFTQSKNTFDLPFSSDTLNWEISEYGVNVFKWFLFGPFRLKAEAGGSYHNAEGSRTINRNSWTDFDAGSEFVFQPLEIFSVTARAAYKSRSDSKEEFSAGAGFKVNPATWLEVSANASAYENMPTIQHMYWSSLELQGNSSLENERGISLYGRMNIKPHRLLSFGVSGRFRQSENSVFLDVSDSTFINGQAYSEMAGTAFAKFENRLLEIESSATVLNPAFEVPVSTTEAVNRNTRRIWIRNNAFIKGYAFDRAAYLKGGIRTVFSPEFYSSRTFSPAIQYWQAGAPSEVQINSFFRMDAELSARVRAIMVVIRWENTLDGIGQAGYFEAATYPMPARRLIIGIRAQFRN